MKDESRTKKELIQDLVSLRKKITSLEKSASRRTGAKKPRQDSEEIFRTIFEAASDGILIVDNKTKRFVTGNPSICRMLGYTADELATIGIKDIHPEAALPHVMQFIKDMATQRINVASEVPVRKKDGSVFYADIRFSTIRVGTRQCLVGVFRNISERMHREKMLYESEMKLREANKMLQLILDTIPVRVFWKDRNSVYLGCNRLFAQDAGRESPEEIIGDTDFNMGWRDEADLYRADDALVVSSGEAKLNYEEPETTPDGRQIWLRTSKVPLRDEEEKIIGIMGTYEDITEKKLSEESVKWNETRLQSLVNILQHKSESIQDFLDYALNEAIRLTDSKIGYIYYYSEGTNQFTLNTWSKDIMKECTIAEPQTVYDLDKTGIWGEAVRQRQPIVVNDFHAPHPQKKGYPEGHARLHKYMTVPVFSGDSIVAVVGVANKLSDYNQTEVLQLTLLMDSVWKVVERKWVEDLVREGEAKIESIFRAAPVGIGMVINRVLQEVNETLCRMTGYSREELIGKNARILYPTREDYDFVGREKYRQIDERGTGSVETRWQRKDGSIMHIILSSTPLDAGNLSKGVTFTALDITERKKSEEKIENAAREWRTTFDSIKDLVFILDHDLKIVRINKATSAFFNLPMDKILGSHYYTLMHGTMEPPPQCPITRMLETKKHEDAELYDEKRKLWIYVSVDPILDDAGAIRGVVHIVKDITERKKTEEARLESERRYQALFDRSLDGIFVHDFEGNFLDANEAALHMLGYERADIPSLNFAALIDETQIPFAMKAIQELLETGVQQDITEFRLRRKDGTHIYAETASSVIYKEGKPFAAQGMARDTTLKKLSEERTFRSLREKETLLKEIHHRVKNNLQVVSSLLSLQSDQVDDEGMRTILHESEQRIRSMAMVHESLYTSDDLSSIDVGEYIRYLVGHLYQVYRTDIDVIRPVIDIDDVLFGIETAIPCGLITNELVSNCLKYAFPDGKTGTITITLRHLQDDTYRLAVSDDGIGISPDIDIRSPRSFGLTLLTIFTEQLDGTIEVDRTRGTSFIITFQKLKYEKRV